MASRQLQKLTVLSLRSLVQKAKRTGKGVPGKSDGGGLTFTVSKTGYPAWVLRYRFQGNSREDTLDDMDTYGDDFGLAKAREAASDLRSRIKAGEDVARTKQEQSSEIPETFKALADEWYARTIEPTLEHPRVVRGVLDKHIIPALGKTPPEEVHPCHIDYMLRAVVDSGAPTVANDALRHVKRILAYARKRHIVPHNVAADFDMTDAGGKEKARTRNLTREELQVLFKAMRETPMLGRPNELAFKILLATCVRKMELVGAKWEEFDLDAAVWHLPGERTKTEVDIDIPLAPQVREWLRELHVFAAGSAYVLPARRLSKRFPHISPDTLNVALKRVKHGLESFTIHDARRTARTQLAQLGISSEVAERALNHKIRGVEGIYNKHAYFEERKKALETWTDLLVALDQGEEGKVVPIRQKA